MFVDTAAEWIAVVRQFRLARSQLRVAEAAVVWTVERRAILDATTNSSFVTEIGERTLASIAARRGTDTGGIRYGDADTSGTEPLTHPMVACQMTAVGSAAFPVFANVGPGGPSCTPRRRNSEQ
jgi:hypothetical protein